MNLFRLSLLLLSAGCSDMAMSPSGKYGGDTSTGAEDIDTGPPDDEETGLPREPAWYAVRAELTVAGGVATADAASITIEVVDTDLVRTDCEVALDTSGVTALAEAADDGTVWWDTAVSPSEDVEPCATLPARLVLGVGAMHPDIRARLGTVDHDDIGDSLYAAYLGADGGDVVAFGYAGTASDLLGDDVAALPAPDGLYQLAPLYLVALPE